MKCFLLVKILKFQCMNFLSGPPAVHYFFKLSFLFSHNFRAFFTSPPLNYHTSASQNTVVDYE